MVCKNHGKLIVLFVTPSWRTLKLLRLPVGFTQNPVSFPIIPNIQNNTIKKHPKAQSTGGGLVLSIRGVDVVIVLDYKYLGVHIDNKLDWAKNSPATYVSCILNVLLRL